MQVKELLDLECSQSTRYERVVLKFIYPFIRSYCDTYITLVNVDVTESICLQGHDDWPTSYMAAMWCESESNHFKEDPRLGALVCLDSCACQYSERLSLFQQNLSQSWNNYWQDLAFSFRAVTMETPDPVELERDGYVLKIARIFLFVF